MRLYVELELDGQSEAAALSALTEALEDGLLQDSVNDASEGSVVVTSAMVLTEGALHKHPTEPSESDEADDMVAEHGTPEQLRRLRSGVLPEEELRELIRRHVFGPAMIDVDGHPLARFEPVGEGFVHAGRCPVKLRGAGARLRDLRIDSGPATEVPRGPWAEYEKISALCTHRLARHRVVVQPRFHRAYCPQCDESETEYGALVTIEFAGRKLSREYAL